MVLDHLNSIVNFSTAVWCQIDQSMSLWELCDHRVLVQEGASVGTLTADEDTRTQEVKGIEDTYVVLRISLALGSWKAETWL